jgi:hypothetical protein
VQSRSYSGNCDENITIILSLKHLPIEGWLKKIGLVSLEMNQLEKL